ncbi:hypothetical protein J2Y69_003183 [Microbacterium resistens]|uniref:AbiEi antitoxin C-terminal domain-containing protein n=1 Tax=Microbacterium resistens TaxID=156977 RepID=A0ABU1SG93_9MICO|nr:type IV toxin-antitoxin system AbiEi family antitoxin [Microbacterium resistens]MDR6868564.1 hypothetical protein [Microbacterium resistens]
MLDLVHAAGFLLLPGDRLSQAELCAARLDGDVVEIGDAYAPADRVETAHLRAAAIAGRRGPHSGLAFAGTSAAWIHGAGDAPPERHELQLTERRRVRLASPHRVLLHERRLPASDTVVLDDVRVACPVRTLVDLARWASRREDALRWALALAVARPELLAEAGPRIEQFRGTPGHRTAERLFDRMTRAALRPLEACQDTRQDEVTR